MLVCVDGKAFTGTLDRFGHSASGGGRLLRTVHISGHAVRRSTLKRQFGWAALSARVLRGGGSASASLFRTVVVGGDVCAPRAGDGSSGVWSERGVDERTALAPSPTAEATRFSEVRRTSP